MPIQQHVLLYTDDPGTGGVAQYNHSLLCEMARQGYRVTCVQPKADTPMVRQERDKGINHVWFKYDPLTEYAHSFEVFEPLAILGDARPDLVILSNGTPLSNLGTQQALLQLDIPYIIVLGIVLQQQSNYRPSFVSKLKKIYKRAYEVVAVSNHNLSLLHQLFHLPKYKGRVIHYGRPTEYFKPIDTTKRVRKRIELQIPECSIVCLTAARLEEFKGFKYQLEAIRELKNLPIWESIYFVWAGAGPLEADLKEWIIQMGIEEHVKLIGQRWDVADLLNTSDIFILPSDFEGMPLAIMEAMAKGIPVIATAVSGVPEELGETGKLLPDPNNNPEATVQALLSTIHQWTEESQLRIALGKAAKERAMRMFTEERMLGETIDLIKRALLPEEDYVAPGLEIIQPDQAFPYMAIGNPNLNNWPYLRREIPHNWYVDDREATIGFLSRDEASILYNTALQFKGKRALEIGCWMGWSACHLALAGVVLDVVDPVLENASAYESVFTSLQSAGVAERVTLHAGLSPEKVEEITEVHNRKWPLIFIDGNHEASGPLLDAIVCENLAEEDAIILFHDLASPEVAQGLDYLQVSGWNTMVYQTMQIMGVAWRGKVQPIHHTPDPRIDWLIPKHLEMHIFSGSHNPFITSNRESRTRLEFFVNVLKHGVGVEILLKAAQYNINRFEFISAWELLYGVYTQLPPLRTDSSLQFALDMLAEFDSENPDVVEYCSNRL
jgi:glycosyltransferase involved in cell wall biosynthesis/predicted O-methyltransferase YrrM